MVPLGRLAQRQCPSTWLQTAVVAQNDSAHGAACDRSQKAYLYLETRRGWTLQSYHGAFFASSDVKDYFCLLTTGAFTL